MERTSQRRSRTIIERKDRLAGYSYIISSTPLHGDEQYHILLQHYCRNFVLIPGALSKGGGGGNPY